MPELPEVETIRRDLEERLRGRTILSATADSSVRYQDAATMTGRRLGELRRKGKYLLLEVDEDNEAVIHLGMTGSLQVLQGTADPVTHERVRWVLDNHTALVMSDARKFGRVTLTPRGDYRRFATLLELGPEPLEGTFVLGEFAARLQASKAPVKALLLGQKVVAGVGNIYADEALWLAHIHPATPGDLLHTSDISSLRHALRHVLQQSIDNRGTSFRDYRTGEGTQGGNQDHLHAYGRAGLPCERCHNPLVKSVVAGRGTVHCPSCQKLLVRPSTTPGVQRTTVAP